MNQYRMFFAQTSALPPSKHRNLPNMEGLLCTITNSQPKTHVELEDNPNVIEKFGAHSFHFTCISGHAEKCLCHSGARGPQRRRKSSWSSYIINHTKNSSISSQHKLTLKKITYLLACSGQSVICGGRALPILNLVNNTTRTFFIPTRS